MLRATNRNVFCLRFTTLSLKFDGWETHRLCFRDIECNGYWSRLLMPNFERIFSRGYIFKYKLSVLLCFREVRRFGNYDIGGHFGVHVAKHRPDPGLIEQVIYGLVLRVSSQIESGRAGGKDVVADFVAVRKGHGCSGKHGQNVGNKREIQLI